ncbi:unnamed protein product, partial [Discosporangium mesarthrocarpum]
LDVAIVGGGPAGLALALSLKGKGLSVRVFESTAEVKERGSAVFLQPIGMAALEEMKAGLAQEMIDAGRVIECIHLMRATTGETIYRLNISGMKEAFGYPFIGITRYTLQRVLMSHLEESDVVLSCQLEGLSVDEGPEGLVELRFAGRDVPARARTVIGADGRR